MKKVLTKVLLLAFLVLSVTACSNGAGKAKDSNKVVVAASPVPHAQILNQVKDMMKEKGYELEVREFTDYVVPNMVVDSGEVDANYFQHLPYLNDFNKEKGTKIVSVGAVHYEPFGIYLGSKKVFDVSFGDKIAVPNDVTNEARALLLLQDAGIIKLRDGASLTATIADIVENPNNVEIVELESAQIPRALDSVSFACMNGNYAMEAGFNVSDAAFVEKSSSEAAKQYANIVCVKQGNENAEFVKALMDCLHSDTVKNFIDNEYNKSVIPIQ